VESVKTTTENGRSVQCERKCQISQLTLTLRRMQNEFLQVDATANALRHRVINCHSNTLQIKVTADSQPITVA